MGKTTNNNIRGHRGVKRAEELKNIDRSQILIVGIDTARDFPKALICNYLGEILEKPFFFTANFESITMLHFKIQHWVGCVKAQRVYIGVEAAGNYHKDIVDSLIKLGYQVSIVNGFSTASQRRKMLDYSKTDDKDLRALCQLIIDNDGLTPKRITGKYEILQLICRARRQYVREQTTLKIQIQGLMTSIFREFQGLIEPEKRSKVKIFRTFWNAKSRFIMRNYPRPEHILGLGEKQLIQKARAHNIKFTQREIKLLFKAAHRALPHCDQQQIFLSKQVQFKLEQLEAVEKQIVEIELEIEELFITTTAILLLTIKGINVVTAAEFIAEIGNIRNYTYNRQLIKLAGTNPVVVQSGGKEGNNYKISRQGNPRLRYIVALIGRNLCNKKCRNNYFINYYERLAQKGKKELQIYNAAANKFLKIAFSMLRDLTVFHIPGFEESTSNIANKVSSKNKDVALENFYTLIAAHDQKKHQAVL